MRAADDQSKNNTNNMFAYTILTHHFSLVTANNMSIHAYRHMLLCVHIHNMHIYVSNIDVVSLFCSNIIIPLCVFYVIVAERDKTKGLCIVLLVFLSAGVHIIYFWDLL